MLFQGICLLEKNDILWETQTILMIKMMFKSQIDDAGLRSKFVKSCFRCLSQAFNLTAPPHPKSLHLLFIATDCLFSSLPSQSLLPFLSKPSTPFTQKQLTAFCMFWGFLMLCHELPVDHAIPEGSVVAFCSVFLCPCAP